MHDPRKWWTWLQHMDGIIVKHTSNCLNLLPAGTSFIFKLVESLKEN